jgi:hypothetical protein
MLKDIVADNRPAPVAAPSANVTVVGSGRVQDFDVGPKYRPYVPPKEEDTKPTERPGWQPETPLRQPDGLREIDAMVMAQDLADLEARGRAEAARMGISFHDWVKLTEKDLRERRERREKAAKAKEGK